MRDRLIYVNGALASEGAAHVSALDRGFTLGDGVFDTMRAVGGRVFRLEDHMDRLEGSALAIGLYLPHDRSALAGIIRTLLEANGLEDALVRMTVSRGVPAERGLLPSPAPTPSLVVVATPFHGYPEEWYRRGYRAVVSAIRRNETSPLSRIKSCCYLDPILARMEARDKGADEALLLNTAGSLACGSSSNLFLALEGRLVTPSLESGVLLGVTRRAILEAAAEMGILCKEQSVLVGAIEKAAEAFLTNTALGVMPLVTVDGRPIGAGAPGPITLRLRSAYLAVLSSRF